MTTHSIQRFWHKPWNEKITTAQFLFRKSLAKLPYVPVPVRLEIAPGESLRFWWSYLVGFYSEDRALFDYWGGDADDLRFLWRTLKPGNTFLDVGAFHGVYSIVAGKRVTPAGRVIAFEPSPRDRRRLQLHLRWNAIRPAKVEPFAVGAESSETPFFQVISGDPTRNGLKPPASDDAVTKITVQTISLDQYISEKNIQRIDVMKLDVEGGELEVLRGAAKMFARFRPILICEVLDETTLVWGYPARDIISFLSDADYLWFECAADGTLIPHEIREGYPAVRNYVAIPREKLQFQAAR
jgi:FkbM family methyltransferase